MRLNTEDRGGIKLVTLSGELRGDPPGEFIAAVSDLLAGPGSRVVLDLGAVRYINSSGLGELVRVAAQANVQEGRVVLANPSAFLSGMLEATQLNRFFEIAPSAAAAIQRLQ
jgi:anti-sigma B factor antagonist